MFRLCLLKHMKLWTEVKTVLLGMHEVLDTGYQVHVLYCKFQGSVFKKHNKKQEQEIRIRTRTKNKTIQEHGQGLRTKEED